MIGRGAIMNPLLPAQIKQVSSDISTHEVSELTGIRSDVETFRSFINEIMEEYIDEMSNEKQVVMKMKELWSYFAIGTKLDRRLLKEIHKVNRLSDYKSAVQMVISQIR
jgi:tRNA-dihydrouridine synthase